MKLVVILPTGWEIEHIRYLQADVTEPVVMDLEGLDTPLDTPDSLYNYPWKVCKRVRKPTG